MFVHNIARPHLSLTLGTQERRIDKHQAVQVSGISLRNHRRRQAPHRVPDDDRPSQPQTANETQNITGENVIGVSGLRIARTTVSSGTRHDDVELVLETSRQGRPTRAAPHQSMQQHDRGLRRAGPHVANLNAVPVAESFAPRIPFAHHPLYADGRRETGPRTANANPLGT
jgi:hypothetical protein